GRRRSLHESSLLDPIDQSGQAAFTEYNGTGQFGHRQALVRRPVQLSKHVEPAKRSSARGLELAIEDRLQSCMGDKERVPGIEARLLVRSRRGHSGMLRSDAHGSATHKIHTP